MFSLPHWVRFSWKVFIWLPREKPHVEECGGDIRHLDIPSTWWHTSGSLGWGEHFPCSFLPDVWGCERYRPRGEQFIKLLWLIKSQCSAEASRDALFHYVFHQAFSHRRARPDRPSVRQRRTFSFSPLYTLAPQRPRTKRAIGVHMQMDHPGADRGVDCYLASTESKLR